MEMPFQNNESKTILSQCARHRQTICTCNMKASDHGTTPLAEILIASASICTEEVGRNGMYLTTNGCMCRRIISVSQDRNITSSPLRRHQKAQKKEQFPGEAAAFGSHGGRRAVGKLFPSSAFRWILLWPNWGRGEEEIDLLQFLARSGQLSSLCTHSLQSLFSITGEAF